MIGARLKMWSVFGPKRRFVAMRPSKTTSRASAAVASLCLAFVLPAVAANTSRHFAPNGNFNSSGKYLPDVAGFNLADVSSVNLLNALPAGVQGLVWVGQCAGVDAKFIATIEPYIGNPKLFGFYLMDEPDPTGSHSPGCPADTLKAESDWIHAHAQGAKTFIVLANMSSAKAPSFDPAYSPASSHIDLFGLAVYPCRTELSGCDYEMISRTVGAAESAGIPRGSIVPVYQAFGGGNWLDDGGGQYIMPTAGQERQILASWRMLVPSPVFDYVFSWGSQNADVSLESAPDLREVFLLHNNATPVVVK